MSKLILLSATLQRPSGRQVLQMLSAAANYENIVAKAKIAHDDFNFIHYHL